VRRTPASLLIRHGMSIKTVQARHGHATAAESLDAERPVSSADHRLRGARTMRTGRVLTF
jgi:hypothetical protein